LTEDQEKIEFDKAVEQSLQLNETDENQQEQIDIDNAIANSLQEETQSDLTPAEQRATRRRRSELLSRMPYRTLRGAQLKSRKRSTRETQLIPETQEQRDERYHQYVDAYLEEHPDVRDGPVRKHKPNRAQRRARQLLTQLPANNDNKINQILQFYQLPSTEANEFAKRRLGEFAETELNDILLELRIPRIDSIDVLRREFVAKLASNRRWVR
jgi:hypothetical protein